MCFTKTGKFHHKLRVIPGVPLQCIVPISVCCVLIWKKLLTAGKCIIMHHDLCIYEEVRAKNNILSKEREKFSDQNGAKMMKIG